MIVQAGSIIRSYTALRKIEASVVPPAYALTLNQKLTAGLQICRDYARMAFSLAIARQTIEIHPNLFALDNSMVEVPDTMIDARGQGALESRISFTPEECVYLDTWVTVSLTETVFGKVFHEHAWDFDSAVLGKYSLEPFQILVADLLRREELRFDPAYTNFVNTSFFPDAPMQPAPELDEFGEAHGDAQFHSNSFEGEAFEEDL